MLVDMADTLVHVSDININSLDINAVLTWTLDVSKRYLERSYIACRSFNQFNQHLFLEDLTGSYINRDVIMHYI